MGKDVFLIQKRRTTYLESAFSEVWFVRLGTYFWVVIDKGLKDKKAKEEKDKLKDKMGKEKEKDKMKEKGKDKEKEKEKEKQKDKTKDKVYSNSLICLVYYITTKMY